MPNNPIIRDDQSRVAAESAVSDVVRSETTDLAFKTIARVRSRLEAYNKVADAYNGYITTQAEKLKSGGFGDSAFKELGVARLVASWMVESEKFFQEMEPLLNQTEKQVRRGFVEESFQQLDEQTRNRLWDEFNDRKAELIVWFVERVKVAIHDQRVAEERDR